jgi:hypothetical protein
MYRNQGIFQNCKPRLPLTPSGVFCDRDFLVLLVTIILAQSDNELIFASLTSRHII